MLVLEGVAEQFRTAANKIVADWVRFEPNLEVTLRWNAITGYYGANTPSWETCVGKKTKAQERAEDYQQRVKIALNEATAAGAAAAEAYIKTARKSPDGKHVLDACGVGTITLYNPSYPLREALKAVGAVIGHSGGWHFKNLPASTREQSITVNEKAAHAACEVMKQHFPNEGEFYASSRMD